MQKLVFFVVISVFGIISAKAESLEFTLTAPAEASVQIAQKTNDYVAMTEIPFSQATTNGGNKTYTYQLTSNGVYFYRVWGDNLYTQAGIMQVSADMHALTITKEEMTALSPRYTNRDITANNNMNVADIFLNINPQNHLKMKTGDTKDILAQRTWQITDNSTDNRFIEPDYHYTVLNLEGAEDNSVISMERYSTSTDPWTRLTAIGKGTAIVLVTYDAVCANQYSGKGVKTPYLGGSDWSALWKENTGVFVVTVRDEDSGIKANMFANKGMNTTEDKLSGDLLDAEHDVIYYLQEDGHANYTFTPEGAAKVYIAHPDLSNDMPAYTSFEEVGRNSDGSYTLTIKEGRQIVALENSNGIRDYQVITAKPCTRTITNISRPGKQMRAGDKASIQYHGLFHPAGKLSRIYNMTAYVAYNGTPAGVSEYGSAGQYTFAAVESAQLYKHTLSVDAKAGEYMLTDGCIQINGFGDQTGNHRNTSRTEGRVFSGNAPSRKVYLGILPDVKLTVDALKHHIVSFTGLPDDAKLYVMDEAKDTLKAISKNKYDLILGSFNYSVEAAGYAPYHSAFTISTSMNDDITITPRMTKADNAWDGSATSEPQKTNWVYQITSAAELAWLAQQVNTASDPIDAVLLADISLGGHEWTAIGTNSKPYSGTFDGQEHIISGLYIHDQSGKYQGLFGKLKNGTVKNLTVEGFIHTESTHTAGVSGACDAGHIEDCHFRGTVITEKNYTAGVVGYVNGADATVTGCSADGYICGATSTGGVAGALSTASDIISDCCNRAFVSGTGKVGGIAGQCHNDAVIRNVYNAANLQMRPVKNTFGVETYASTIGAICGITDYGNLQNGYAATAYNNEDNENNKTIVLDIDACADGTLAALLGWKQNIGTDPYPVLKASGTGTALEAPDTADEARKLLINGRLLILRDGRIYDASGNNMTTFP